MNIQNVILGFLYEEPMTGYDIKGRFDRSVSHFFEASFGGIYPALRRMEADGLIVKEVQHQDGKPSRNVFAITSEGRAAFSVYLDSPVAPSVQRSDLLLRLFFGSYSNAPQIAGWLEQERKRQLEGLEGLLRMKEGQLGDPNADPFRMKTLNFGIAQVKLALEWTEHELEELRRREG